MVSAKNYNLYINIRDIVICPFMKLMFFSMTSVPLDKDVQGI